MSREAALYHSPALGDQPARGKGAISLANGSPERAYHHVGVLGRPFRARFRNVDPLSLGVAQGYDRAALRASKSASSAPSIGQVK